MRFALAFLIAIVAGDAAAQSVVMYRCTDAQGAVTLQNDVPCPKGSKQVRRVIDAPAPKQVTPYAVPAQPSAPTPAAAPAPVAPLQPATATAPPSDSKAQAPSVPVSPSLSGAVPVATPVAAPALYRCANYKREIYLSETDLPPSQCVPMQAVGLDGNPNTGAGAVCERVQDPCEPIADAALCDTWRQRFQEADAAIRFGTPEQAEKAKPVFNRSQAVLRDSCPAL